jgi:hypothetical protein
MCSYMNDSGHLFELYREHWSMLVISLWVKCKFAYIKLVIVGTISNRESLVAEGQTG